jgi:hypothetical protein
MPPKNDDDKQKNMTLRLPEEYHRQLVDQANRRGLTLNSLLSVIVHRHLLDSGYAPEAIKSLSGRLFEVNVESLADSYGDFFCSRFDIVENHPLYNKRRAHYLIGVSYSLIGNSDPAGIVKDVGLALLNFYNRKGLELDQLAWQKGRNDPPTPSPGMLDNWRYIGSTTTNDVAEFLLLLGKNHWTDDLLAVTGQSQDIRCNLRTEADLYRGNKGPLRISE